MAILGLFLAFVPALIFLSLANSHVLAGNHLGNTFWAAFLVSVVCCFVSSFLLVRHQTLWAIIVGFLFFWLNAMISCLLGCGAVFSR